MNTAISGLTLAQPDASTSFTTLATLQFLVPGPDKPRNFTFDPPEGVARSNAHYAPHQVEIRDIRAGAENFDLDREGFAVVAHDSAVKDFWNETEIRDIYYAEAARLISDVTGADRVFVFDHTLRRRVPGADDRAPDAPRQPATRVHVDQTAKSGAQRVRDLLPDEAERLLRGRVQIINLWRPLRGPLWDSPLALCDAQSVAPADLIPSDLVYPDRVGETYAVAYNENQRWFYLRGMRPSEALLLKCYDSATDGRARFAPHTAFIDPTAPTDAPPRESIELRTLVFHAAT